MKPSPLTPADRLLINAIKTNLVHHISDHIGVCARPETGRQWATALEEIASQIRTAIAAEA